MTEHTSSSNSHSSHGPTHGAVDPALFATERGLTVAQGHDVSSAVQGALLEHLPYLSSATIHVDPVGAAGSDHHPQANQNDHHADEHANEHGTDHAH